MTFEVWTSLHTHAVKIRWTPINLTAENPVPWSVLNLDQTEIWSTRGWPSFNVISVVVSFGFFFSTIRWSKIHASFSEYTSVFFFLGTIYNFIRSILILFFGKIVFTLHGRNKKEKQIIWDSNFPQWSKKNSSLLLLVY